MTVTTYARTGNTSTTRTLQIAQAAGQSDAQSKEYTDHLGRLIQVDEPSGNSNATTSTIYHYDIGDRLTLVQSGVQTRSFVYDGRGLLVAETHPEKGQTTYVIPNSYGIPQGYDARGHARRRVDGSPYGPFDVTYSYDAAERLVSVQDFDQTSNTTPKAQRTLKAFTFATSNSPAGCTDTSAGNCDAHNAKLSTATRYNRRSGGIGDVTVTELYAYTGRGGRPSLRDTTLQSGFPFLNHTYQVSQAWNDLGLVSSTIYPAECPNGNCSGSLSSYPFPVNTVSRTYRNEG
jgi:YD repeat-containing protein